MQLFYFILQVILYFITMASIDNKKPPTAKLEDLDVPEVSEVKSIAVTYGTYKQKSPNLIWYGNMSTSEIREKVGSWPFDDTVTVGYRYYLTQWYALSHGEIDIHEIYMDDKIIWQNTGQSGNFTSSYRTNSGLFMNDKEYFQADFDFYSGNQNQPTNAHLVSKGVDAPQYPGIAHVVFRLGSRGAIIGNSLSLRPLSFVCTRFPDILELDDTYKNVNGDCNPAWIMYDILTANKYGLGLDPQYIDIPSFDAAAKFLYEEGFGLSLIYEDKFRCDDFIKEILRHIAGNLVEDNINGKLKLKLIRDDYDSEDLPVFDESNIQEIQSFSRTTKNELYNEVKVTYTNSSNNFKQSTSIFQNLGLDFTDRAAKQRSVTMDFPWITKESTASKVASREAIPMTSVLSSVRFKAYRQNDLEVGDVIKVSWDKYGMNEIIYRIQDINYGNLNNNFMIVSAIQDSFSINFTSYSGGGDNKFEDINVNPKDMTLRFIECPYFVSPQGNNLLYYPLQNDQSSLYYEVYTKEEGEGSYKLTSGEYPFGDFLQSENSISITQNSIDLVPITIPLSDASREQNLAGKNMLLLIDQSSGEHEFISFSNIDYEYGIPGFPIERISGIRRGCMDTKPRAWPANTSMYIFQKTISENVDLQEGENISMKAVSTTVSGTYPLPTASEVNYIMNSQQRNKKPILGGYYRGNNQDVVVNDTVILSDTQDVEINWLYKNLSTQSSVYGYYEGDSSNTSGTNYVINIYDNTDNTLIKTHTTQSNSYIFDDETTINPVGERYSNLRIEIHSELNTYISRENIIYYVQRP